MKKLMLGLMMAFAATAKAATEKENILTDSLKATLDDKGVLTSNGSGPMPNWGRVEDQVWYDEVIKIKSVVGEGVTSVGKYAFRNCASLTSVSLPKATKIGAGAFRNCNSIETVALSWELLANPDRTGWGLRDQAKLLGPWTKEDVENTKVGDVVWTICEAQVKNKDYEVYCAYYGITPKSVQVV